MDAEGFGATSADVEERIARDFQGVPSAEEVRRLLEGVPRDHSGDFVPRLQMAVLEPAAGDVSEVESLVHLANVDWRDVLAPAFGGMGSWTDLLIHPRNGHQLDEADVDAVNVELAALRGEVHRETAWLLRALRSRPPLT